MKSDVVKLFSVPKNSLVCSMQSFVVFSKNFYILNSDCCRTNVSSHSITLRNISCVLFHCNSTSIKIWRWSWEPFLHCSTAVESYQKLQLSIFILCSSQFAYLIILPRKLSVIFGKIMWSHQCQTSFLN